MNFRLIHSSCTAPARSRPVGAKSLREGSSKSLQVRSASNARVFPYVTSRDRGLGNPVGHVPCLLPHPPGAPSRRPPESRRAKARPRACSRSVRAPRSIGTYVTFSGGPPNAASTRRLLKASIAGRSTSKTRADASSSRDRYACESKPAPGINTCVAPPPIARSSASSRRGSRIRFRFVVRHGQLSGEVITGGGVVGRFYATRTRPGSLQFSSRPVVNWS